MKKKLYIFFLIILTACSPSPEGYITYIRKYTYDEKSGIRVMTPEGNDYEAFSRGYIQDLAWSNNGQYVVFSEVEPDDQSLKIGIIELSNKTFLKEVTIPEDYTYGIGGHLKVPIPMNDFNGNVDRFAGIGVVASATSTEESRIFFGINKPDGAFICDFKYELYKEFEKPFEPNCEKLSGIFDHQEISLIDMSINTTQDLLLSVENDETNEIYLTDTHLEQSQFLTNGSSPEFNPDGTKMVFINDQDEICEMNLMDQKINTVYAPKDQKFIDFLQSMQNIIPISHPSYSPDEKWIVFCGNRFPERPTSIFKINIKSGDIKMLTPQENANSCYPQWRHLRTYPKNS